MQINKIDLKIGEIVKIAAAWKPRRAGRGTKEDGSHLIAEQACSDLIRKLR